MKREIYILFCLIVFLSCQNETKLGVIQINLADTKKEIRYSDFVKSIDYDTLELPEAVPINGVERLFFDDGKVFIKDSGHEGILVFNEKTGHFIKRIKELGDGPEEIKEIGAFCLDTYHKQLLVFDKGDMKIKVFDYWGNYKKTNKAKSFFLDMVKTEEKGFICFYPIYAFGEQPNGVWLSDSTGVLLKTLQSKVTKDCKFHYFPMMYNWNDSCAYYYDRNWNELSVITADTLRILYKFDIKQALPLSVKGTKGLTYQKLDKYSIVHQFAYSDNYILISFQTFHKDDMQSKDITWMLFNPKTGGKSISKKIVNDVIPIKNIQGNSLFYKDNHTWVRVDETLDNAICLEKLYLY